MNAAPNYDKCLEMMAQVCADAERSCNLLMAEPACPAHLLEEAQQVKAAADDAMLGLIELRMGVL